MSHADWTQGSTDQARANKIFEKGDRADDLKPRTRLRKRTTPAHTSRYFSEHPLLNYII